MKKEPIVIQDQGSFFVGGSIVKGEGTFDPMNPPDCFILRTRLFRDIRNRQNQVRH